MVLRKCGSPALLRTRLKEAPSSFRATRDVILKRAAHVVVAFAPLHHSSLSLFPERGAAALSQAWPPSRSRTVSFCAWRSIRTTAPCPASPPVLRKCGSPALLRTRLKNAPSSFRATRDVILNCAAHVVVAVAPLQWAGFQDWPF